MRRAVLLALLLSCLAAVAFAADLQLTVQPEARRFSFGTAGGVGFERVRFGLDLNGKTYWAQDATRSDWEGEVAGPGTFTLRFDEPGIVWSIHIRRGEDGTSAVLSSTIRNTGGSAVKLGRCRLADLTDATAALRLGAGDGESLLFVESGWNHHSGVHKIRNDGKQLESRTLAQFYNPVSKAALQLAFLSFDRIHTEHAVWWDETLRRVVASSYSDFLGYALNAGATIASEELALEIRPDPIESLNHWGDLAKARYHVAVWPDTPAGWLGWAWFDGIYAERYEDIVRRNVEAIRKRLPGRDINYVWVSLGNLKDISPGNWLRWNYDLFPSSPQKLVSDLDQAGFRLGLWVAPFWLGGKVVPEAETLRDAFLQSGGKPLVIPRSDIGDTFALDPSHPKTQQFLRDVFSTYREWGIRYYMLDFLNAVSGPIPGTYKLDGYYDRSAVPGPQALREGLKVVREAAGPDTYVLGGVAPSFQLVGLIDGMRTGADYGEGRPLYGPGKWYYPGTYIINRPDHWQAHRAALQAMASAFFAHRKLFLSDSGNVLTIDKPLPMPDAQISATIFGINGGPMMLGDDIARMAPGRLEMIQMELPRLPETAAPVDLFERPEPDFAHLFHLPVRREWDQWELAAIFNPGDEPMTQTVDFSRLGLDPKKPQAVWDFWSERYLGVPAGGITVHLAPRSVVLLRIAAARDYPWILSTDMHIRQGQAEIENCQWDAGRMTLTVSATRPVGSVGNVYLRVPKGFAFRNPAGLWLAKDGNDGSLIVRCAFDFSKSAHETRTLTLVPDTKP